MNRQQLLLLGQARQRQAEADAGPQEVNTDAKANQPDVQQKDATGNPIGYQPPSKLQSALLGAVDTTMFGFPDELAGAANYAAHLGKEGSYTEGRNAYRQGVRVSQEENPKSFLAGQIGGGIASTMMMPTGAALRGAALLPKVARTAMIGATEGGLYGTGSAEGGLADRAQGALEGATVGGLMGGAGPVIGRAIGKITGKLADLPTLDYARGIKDKIYKKVEEAGIVLNPMETNKFWGRLSNRLAAETADPTNHGGTIAVVNAFEKAQAKPQLSLTEIDKLRSRLGEITAQRGPDAYMARQVRKEIDKVTTGLQASQVGSLAGEPPQRVVRLLKDARDANTRYRNTETIQTAIDKATSSSRAVQSGDMEGALQTQFRKIYDNKRTMGFLSNAERKMVSRIVTEPTSKAKARFLNDLTKRYTFGLADTPGEAVGAAVGGFVGNKVVPYYGAPVGAAIGTGAVRGIKRVVGIGGNKERLSEQLVASAAKAGTPIQRITGPAERKATNALLSAVPLVEQQKPLELWLTNPRRAVQNGQ